MLYNTFFKDNKSIWLAPFMLIALLFIGHSVLNYYSSFLTQTLGITGKIVRIEQYAYMLCMAAAVYWLCIRLLSKGFSNLQNSMKNYHTVSLVIPFFNALLKALAFLVIFKLFTQHLELNSTVSYVLSKVTSIMIIGAIGWLLCKLIDVAQQLLLHHFTADSSGINLERKVFTQTVILKRVAYTIVSILTAGAILILFDNVRALGASVLTTAGVFGLVLTFTAQRSLASIFSGLEIALTQPIKIGDSVVIDNEFGVIEEINFRSVVIKLWDWRRLIVPTNLFLEKTFQNWSKVQDTNLIGTVYLYVDFSLPVKELRSYLELILQKTPHWDRNVGLLQVGDLQERVMQLKILASASNADSLSNLRAFLREELIGYIVQKYPYALPKTRSYALKNDLNKESLHNANQIMEALS